jgi:ubiquinone/menaquinone biosynthesis C-methylase UbiE
VAFADHLARANPYIMKLAAKHGYRLGTRLMDAEEILFINWAYEENPPMALPLSASDERDRFHIQLYHRTAAQVDLSGKRVLEVSCGHGGGASYLMRTLHPASYTGVDLNPAGIEFCRRRHQLPGLDFVQANAENLPFADEAFDVVINVEASHLYFRFSRFLAEVARVLRTGGHFLYADLRTRHLVAEWEAALTDAPMRCLSRRIVDDEVRRGLEKTSPRAEYLISRRIPPLLQGFVRDRVGVQGGTLYQAVESGEFSYRIYCFVKN